MSYRSNAGAEIQPYIVKLLFRRLLGILQSLPTLTALLHIPYLQSLQFGTEILTLFSSPRLEHQLMLKQASHLLRRSGIT